jgi:RNA polymerase sigma factor (sigma-70 family)
MTYTEQAAYDSISWTEDRESNVAIFNKLHTRLSPTIRRISQKLSFRFSFVDEADLYQEALLHLWTSFSDKGSEEKTDSFILQGCYFHLRNHIRTIQENAITVNLSDPVDEDGTCLGELLPWEGISVSDEVEGKLQLEALKADGMTKQELAVLTMSLENFTTREIGSELGVSHVRVVKIKDKLRDRYKNVIAFPRTKAHESVTVRAGIRA